MQSIPVFLPREFHGQRSLAGYSPWGHKELDATEHTHRLNPKLLLNIELSSPKFQECQT